MRNLINNHKWSEIQFVFTFLNTIENKGFSVELFKKTVENETNNRLNTIANQNNNLEKCPKCNWKMVKIPLNIEQGRANLYGHKFVSRCLRCMYEEFS